MVCVFLPINDYPNLRKRTHKSIVTTYHVDVNAPLVCSSRIVCDDIFENCFSSFTVAHLELHLSKLGRQVNVMLLLQVLKAALKCKSVETSSDVITRNGTILGIKFFCIAINNILKTMYVMFFYSILFSLTTHYK